MSSFASGGTRILCTIFLASSMGWSAEALALNSKDKPVIRSGRQMPVIKAPSKNIPPVCVQRAGNKNASKNGYHSAALMRRSAALGQIYDKQAVAAIAIASYESGIDFDLLVMKAFLESRMGQYDQPHLGGSARGLFHFMPATWLTLFSWFGAEFQNGVYADVARRIKFDENKNPFTDNPALTDKILALRSDHYVAAFIKAKSVLHDERPLMKAILGREPNFTDYYVAHFLGLDRAKTFFRTLRQTPHMAAADIFIRESEDPNNRPLFYKGDRKLTIQQVYNGLASRVNATLRHLDRIIAAELKAQKCISLMPLIPPPRTAMDIPPMPEVPQTPPEGLPPEKPPLDIQVPDEKIPPAPVPQEEFYTPSDYPAP